VNSPRDLGACQGPSGCPVRRFRPPAPLVPDPSTHPASGERRGMPCTRPGPDGRQVAPRSHSCPALSCCPQKQATMALDSGRSSSKAKQLEGGDSVAGDGSTTLGGDNSLEVRTCWGVCRGFLLRVPHYDNVGARCPLGACTTHGSVVVTSTLSVVMA
jgi:hypothetical protein